MPATSSNQTISNYSPVKTISLKNNPTYNEAWVQRILFENPELLGIGNVTSRDKEVAQPTGGFLDILLQDEDDATRYEVEVQLGATDPSHIIRTIEYWDIEKKRYPDCNHIAVIVAEDITARFFNVISLFNSAIPLIAIKMSAIEQPNGKVGLLFTKVLDLVPRSTRDDETPELVDRSFWCKKATKHTVELAEKYLEVIQQFEPKITFSFTKFYLGTWIDGRVNNSVIMRPKKKYLNIEIRLERSSEIDALIEESDFDLDYISRDGRYRIQVDAKTSEKGEKLVEELMRKAYDS